LSAARAGARLLIQLRDWQGAPMNEPTMKFTVFDIPIAVVANALLMDKGIRLHAGCHGQYWTATFVEREQLRKTLRTMKIETRQDASEVESF
jgi:hypothetical protein